MRPADLAIVVGLGLIIDAGAAHAQSADAEVLFREGRKLVKAGKVEQGCDKLAASEQLESSIGTLLNLGDCRDKLGQSATAWAAFRKAEAMARRANDSRRQAEAARRAAQLEPRLLALVIQVDRRVDGMIVRRDDVVIDPAAWSTAIPVDPGTYEIVAEAPGYRPWRTAVPIDPKLKRRVVLVPALEPAPIAPVAEAPAVAVAPSVEPIAVTRRETPTWSTTRKLSVGLAVAGLGVAGGGVYFGIRSRELADQSDARCPLTLCGDAEALRQNDRARTAATRANVLMAAGGGAVVLATVLWFAGKPGEHAVVVPAAGPGYAGASLAGQF